MANKQLLDLAYLSKAKNKTEEDCKNEKIHNNLSYVKSYNRLKLGEFYGKTLTGKTALGKEDKNRKKDEPDLFDTVIISKKMNLFEIHESAANSNIRGDESFESFDKKDGFHFEKYPDDHMMRVVIDMEENDKWRNKYLRNSALHVIVSSQDEETGYVKSFTLLFENNFSCTFRSYS